MKKYSRALFLFCLLIWFPNWLLAKNSGGCEEVTEALNELPQAGAQGFWARYAILYQNNRTCMEDLFGEGVSDQTANWLAQYWRQIGDIKNTSNGFQKYLAKCLNSTLADTQLAVVQTKAKTKCPAAVKGFCTTLLQNVQQALNDMKDQGLVCQVRYKANESVTFEAGQGGCEMQPAISLSGIQTDAMFCIMRDGKQLSMSTTFPLRNPSKVELKDLCDPQNPVKKKFTGKFLALKGDGKDNDQVVFQVDSVAK